MWVVGGHLWHPCCWFTAGLVLIGCAVDLKMEPIVSGTLDCNIGYKVG